MTNETEHAGMKVLVVEDSRTQAEYLGHILENSAYKVIVATNGKEALEKIRTDRPTIVLTDIVMPEMDGYELCRAIKQDENTASIPVILVTQLFDPADLIKGLEAGADNIIIKPFEPEHVIFRITSTLKSLEKKDAGGEEPDLEVSLAGKKHVIPAGNLHAPAILLSTYDLAIRNNTELKEAQKSLVAANEDLQKKVGDLQKAYDTLLRENKERIRAEDALTRENKRLRMMAGLTRDTVMDQLLDLQKCLEQADVLRENDAAMAWDQIIKAELVLLQTIKTLR
ncbi:MAG TPA: response regulator [Methanoregulaceae archaeon]|nr:response regulator [Methanoregulaceae archaeon]HPD75868.1 response regulator [Methanoregulaceae archaeon]HRY75888.1 response regulator [Methanoregulaceae archaeon]